MTVALRLLQLFVCVYLIYEGNENHSLPFLLLSIKIHFKVGRVILNDGRTFTGHQVLKQSKQAIITFIISDFSH